jgi:hypothetical protein
MQTTDTQRQAGMAFVALVTCWLLALVFRGVLKGGLGPAEVAVYAVTASFGLEFLWTSWPTVWGESRRPDAN